MQAFNFVDNHFEKAGMTFTGAPILPNDSIVLHRTPATYMLSQLEDFLAACRQFKQDIGSPSWVFIDACWDPFRFDAIQIKKFRQDLQEIFEQSKICVLSAAARHFYEDIPGCLYFPLFLMINYPPLNFLPKAGRIGCLNRRNAAHRVWLMHHLLEQKLIDPERDVYSVSFTNLYTGSYYDVGIDWFNEAQRQWPTQISTHPDDFPCDYSIDHPAWHTGISIITETEPGVDTIICEKTAKGILSKSCFSVYMAEVGYRVLEDLGFEPRFFDQHAEEFDIQPIIDICKTITTESQALEYRQQHIDKIEHNFEWFAINTGPFQSRPWWNRYEPKLRQALDSL